MDFRLPAISRNLQLGERQEQEIGSFHPVQPDHFLQQDDGVFEPALAIKRLGLAELGVRFLEHVLPAIVGARRRHFNIVYLAKFPIGQGVVGLGDFIKDILDLHPFRGGRGAVETVGMELPGQVEIGLLDVVLRGLLADPQDLVVAHRSYLLLELHHFHQLLLGGSLAGLIHSALLAFFGGGNLVFVPEVDQIQAIEQVEGLPEKIGVALERPPEDTRFFPALYLVQHLLLFLGQKMGEACVLGVWGLALQVLLKRGLKLHPADTVFDEVGKVDPGGQALPGERRLLLKDDLPVEVRENTQGDLPHLVGESVIDVALGSETFPGEGLPDGLTRLEVSFDLRVGFAGDLSQLEQDLPQSLLGDVGLGVNKIAFHEKKLLLDSFAFEDELPAELPEMNPAEVQPDMFHAEFRLPYYIYLNPDKFSKSIARRPLSFALRLC